MKAVSALLPSPMVGLAAAGILVIFEVSYLSGTSLYQVEKLERIDAINLRVRTACDQLSTSDPAKCDRILRSLLEEYDGLNDERLSAMFP